MVIRFIYEQFLGGDSFGNIIKLLEEEGIKSPSGKDKWTYSTIQSILTKVIFIGGLETTERLRTDCAE